MTTTNLSRAFALALAALLTAVGLTALSSPSQAATTGTIKGVVKNAAGTPLKGIKVVLSMDLSGEERVGKGTKTTDAKGKFTFTKVKVITDPDNDNYSLDAYDPARTYLTGYVQPIVTAGETTTANFSLSAGATIAGKVTREDGKSPAGIEVGFDGGDSYGGATTNAKGQFKIKGLWPGTGTVEFRDPKGDYLVQCYDNVLGELHNDGSCNPRTVPAAEMVTVAGDDTITLKDQQFTFEAGHISGKVTSTLKRPVKGADTVLYNASTGEEFPDIDFSSTPGSGAFRINGVPAGDWKLKASTDSAAWVPIWFDRATTEAAATPIHVVAGKTTGGLKVVLQSAAKLSYKATPGVKKATFAIKVTKRSNGNIAGGKVTVTCGSKTKTVTLKKGKARITLAGIAMGKQTFTISYLGNTHTAAKTKTVEVKVK